MRNLLSAGFARLWRDKLFWLCTVFAVCLQCGVMYNYYRECTAHQLEFVPGEILFTTMPFVCYLVAMIVSFVIGTEFSDGGIRSKISIGHRRSHIYLSQLLVCMTGACVMTSLTILASTALGLLLFAQVSELADFWGKAAGCLLLSAAAMTALCLLICILIGKKAAGAAACLMLVLAMVYGCAYLESRLNEPKIRQEYVKVDSYGKPIEVEEQPNPDYIGGTKRLLYNTVFQILPSGQVSRISNGEFEEAPVIAGNAVALILLTTAAGMAGLRRKDIK